MAGEKGSRQMWAIKAGGPDCQPFWAQEFYVVPCFRGLATALSEQNAFLTVVSEEPYFGDARAQAGLPIDTFLLPDNFNNGRGPS
jgi:hypothetical protein